MIYLILDAVRSDYMDTNSSVYNELNKAWKATCRILFGEEIGELKEYEEWLRGDIPAGTGRKSHYSGKLVQLPSDAYCDGAKFVSYDEIREIGVPLSINEIKDIDSIVEATSERWEYTGNIALGKTTMFEASSLLQDSSYVFGSINIKGCERVHSSSETYFSKYIFGCVNAPYSEFMLKCVRSAFSKRCFSGHLLTNSNDMFFCSNCNNCHEMLFSFNQRNKRHCIGNLELQKDKYLALKKKIVDEIKDELRKDKQFPSIFQLVPDQAPKGISIPVKKEHGGDMSAIEKAFSSACRVLFKREFGSLLEYERWLSNHLDLSTMITSPFGCETYLPSNRMVPPYAYLSKRRTVSAEEGWELGRLKLEEDEIVSLEKIKANIGKIGFFSPELIEGTNLNIIKSPAVIDVSNAYRAERVGLTENVGLSHIVAESKFIFGCLSCIKSQFSIKCYNSLMLNRCFEIDTCHNCSDSLFCHNCDGLQDAMFCFNVKGKRHAIGNTELPPDQYRKIKDMLVEQMADEIVSKKELKYDIFNIGCGKK